MKRALFVLGILLLSLAQLPETTIAEKPSTQGEVSNSAPQIADLEAPPSVIPLAGGTRTVTVEFAALDGNGKKDVVRAELEVLAPGVTAAKHRNQSWLLTPDETNGERQDLVATFTMDYWNAPATGNDSYVVRVRVQDQIGRWSDWAAAPFHYQPLAALELGANGLSFGYVEPGARTEPVALQVRNTGNVPIDLELSGTSLTNSAGGVLSADRVRYDLTGAAFGNETALGSDPQHAFTFDLAPGPASVRMTHWLLDVPTGQEQYVPAGDYQGAITISAVQG